MEDSAIREKLSLIFADTFNSPGLQIADELTADDVEEWDSLTHIDMIVAVEKAFRIKLTTAEVRNLANAGDLVRVISRKAT
jgi:acyl carrier protein